MLPKKLSKQLTSKVQIIPNGIHDVWLNNLSPVQKIKEKTTINLFYVGQIIKRKNIIALINAVDFLNAKENNRRYKLTIVGGENQYEQDYFKQFLDLVNTHEWLLYKGKITDKSKLIKIFRNHDIFTMPSFGELFGLTYPEALSQGLPIVFSKGEGIDGFFKENSVGVAVNPYNIESIAQGIAIVARSTYKGLNKSITPFNWNAIAEEYKNIYEKYE